MADSAAGGLQSPRRTVDGEVGGRNLTPGLTKTGFLRLAAGTLALAACAAPARAADPERDSFEAAPATTGRRAGGCHRGARRPARRPRAPGAAHGGQGDRWGALPGPSRRLPRQRPERQPGRDGQGLSERQGRRLRGLALRRLRPEALRPHERGRHPEPRLHADGGRGAGRGLLGAGPPGRCGPPDRDHRRPGARPQRGHRPLRVPRRCRGRGHGGRGRGRRRRHAHAGGLHRRGTSCDWPGGCSSGRPPRLSTTPSWTPTPARWSGAATS